MALKDVLGSVRREATRRASSLLLPQPVRTLVRTARAVLPERTERQIVESVRAVPNRVRQNVTPRNVANAGLNFARQRSPLVRAATSRAVIGPNSLNSRVIGGEARAQRAERDRLNAEGRRTAANLVPFTRPANAALSIPRAVPRAIMALNVDQTAKNLEFVTGQPSSRVYTPQSKVERAVFGKAPVYGFKGQGKNTSDFFYKGDDPTKRTLSNIASVPLVGLGLVADLLPGGGAAKKGAKELGVEFLKKYGDEAPNILRALQSGSDEALQAIPQKQRSDVMRRLRSAETDAGAVLRTIPGQVVPSPAGVARAADEVLPTAARAVDEIPPLRDGKYLGGVNTTKLDLTDAGKTNLPTVTRELSKGLEELRGAPLSHAEVIEEAKRSELLQQVVTRQQTRDFEAALLATRQVVANEMSDPTLTREFVERFKVVSSHLTDAGRTLNSAKIQATPMSAKGEILQEILKRATDDVDRIVEAAKGVNFDDPKQATAFYRTFVKPSRTELIDEIRYINLLSSPRTHSVNFFSNAFQAGALLPATKLVNAGLDAARVAGAKTLNALGLETNAERTIFASEIPEYYKAAFKSLSSASDDALQVLLGRKWMNTPDVNHLPTGNKFTNAFGFIPRALAAGDAFFTKIIASGEEAALTQRSIKKGVPVGAQAIKGQAADTAQEFLFRGELGNPKQGAVLAGFDEITGLVFKLRELPKVGVAMKFVIPFITTPMNILKQGFQYSPAGVLTIPGAKNKQEQLAKAFIGSMVMYGSYKFMDSHDSTWAAPSGEEARAAFYASGRQPYSIKIGDKWVSYSKLGPIAYPIAMAASLKYQTQQDPKRFDEKRMKQYTDAAFGMAGFFADQSYLTGLDNLMNLHKQDWEGEQARSDLAASAINQMIPLSSLVRWANNAFIDPTFRKSDNVLQSVMKGLPGLSTKLEPYLQPDGTPSTRKLRGVNAISPVQITPSDNKFEKTYEQEQGARSYWESLKGKSKEEINAEFARLYTEDKSLHDKLAKEATYDKLGLTPADRDMIGTGVKDGTRARLIVTELERFETKDEKNEYLRKLYEAKILTEDVGKQLAELLK